MFTRDSHNHGTMKMHHKYVGQDFIPYIKPATNQANSCQTPSNSQKNNAFTILRNLTSCQIRGILAFTMRPWMWKSLTRCRTLTINKPGTDPVKKKHRLRLLHQFSKKKDGLSSVFTMNNTEISIISGKSHLEYPDGMVLRHMCSWVHN